jgi:NitT/TauT family transport system ATP-binding protein
MRSSAAPLLSVENLSLIYQDPGGGLEALQDISFDLAEQEFLSLIGPSGSGKSTMLRVLAGLLQPTEGRVHFSTGNKKPRIGLVFQQSNLMPWRTVLQNILLPLEIAGMEKDAARRKAVEMIHLVRLEEFANAWPEDLSGGMAQRVAIARALVQDPDLLLLDEPFGSLDAITRENMGAELLRIWQASRKAVVFVTHSISEALLLSDRVLVLSARPGRVVLDKAVTLPRPRSEEIRYSRDFLHLERILRSSLSN